MITTKKFYYYPFMLMSITLMLFSSCKKEEIEENEKNLPVLTTTNVTEITLTTAVSGGNVTGDGGETVTAKGICWSTNQEPTINDSKTEDGEGMGFFLSNITGLEPNTTYFIRAYATNSVGTGYGSGKPFTTLEATEPTLTTVGVTEITQTTVISGGYITSDGGATINARGVCWSTSTNPTINDSKKEDGNGSGSFTSRITGLETNTTYYLKAYAINSKGTSYGDEKSFTTYNSDAIIDIDGNYYNIITIGSQVWMAENLRTTKYNNGTDILNLTINSDWSITSSGAYCWYNNEEATNKDTYGALYNWYAVNTGNICPTGWHVPSDEEWTTLTNHVGGSSVAGGKLKSTHTSPDAHPRWDSPNTGATDEFRFSALPGGNRSDWGSFHNIGGHGFWWSSTESSVTNSWLITMRQYEGSVYRLDFNHSKKAGLSIRCLKDL